MGRMLEPEFVGRTYDDFLFRPQASPLASRREVSLGTRLTRRLTLDLPVVSANMDSVTDARMAVAMALEGGLGFVHRGLPIAGQAAEVARVKRTQGHVVERPFCLPRGSTVREARELARRHNVTGLLIEEAPGSGVLAGLLSNRDLPWSAAQDERPVEEFMTPAARLVTGPPDISIEDAERRMFAHRVEKLPLVDGARRVHGLITKKDILAARQRPYSSKDARGPAPRRRGDRRPRRFPGAGGRAPRGRSGRPADRHRPRPLGSDEAGGGGGPRPLRRCRAGVRERRHRRGRGVPSGSRRGRDQGRGGAGTRLPDSAGDRRGGAAAPGDPGGLVRGGGRRSRSSPTAACERTRTCSWR